MEICPAARIDLDRASSEEQVSEVANGNADMGVIRMPVLRRDSRVRFVELAAERLWLALPDGHPLAKQASATVASLQDEPFVSAVYRERVGLARVVTGLCLKRGFVPQPAQIVSPKTSMLNLVAAKRGVAIVPERMTTLGGQGVTYVPLSDEDAKSICALVLPLQPTVLSRTFADILIQEIGS
jgi:DNA-binding transcriptional LysR family regulator